MLYPMFAMVLLTTVIGFIAVRTRFASVKDGEMQAEYYKLMRGGNVTDRVEATSRSFNNQFEIPLLFYVAGTLHIVTGTEGLIGFLLAWVFIISRCAHAYIHLTYNRVLHRLAAYEVGIAAVLGLWINLLVQSGGTP